MESKATSDRSQVKRLTKRAVYDRATINAILDEAHICHVGFVVDGQPFVIPTIHVRIGDSIYLHGSPASRMLQTLSCGGEACISVTLVDGLVLARSAFHHSMNYRSVVLFGRGSPVDDETRKIEVLRSLSEHLIRGRWAEVREPNVKELRQTIVVQVAIDEASAKIRTGPPLDDEEDYALSVWAGVLPLRLSPAAPVADPRLPDGVAVPAYASHYAGAKPVTERE
ncbi:MAG TPA: pyridoxamine 5'-phosphate oxidase family protein [Pirellulales bacterium]|nr:pyridoxamine 5'-phosphate oxidase family protein [Pirellulales bacterium]